ncbi:MAG: hypothetical protein EBX40_07535 [Gammaproteobacteria bacterium]|nr:hypothetical protein [Gammaproteobacteria bacterium]
MVRRKDKYPEETSAREISKRAIQRARATKCLNPHELLKYWANGISIAGVSPDEDMQVQCAIAAAPYYASKLQSMEVKSETSIRAVISASPMTISDWSKQYLGEALPSAPLTLDAPPVEVEATTNNIVSAPPDTDKAQEDDEF